MKTVLKAIAIALACAAAACAVAACLRKLLRDDDDCGEEEVI